MIKALTADWKDRVRPILQLYVDRLPGALLEEKEFSLAWHYRRADPDQASLRARSWWTIWPVTRGTLMCR